MAVRKINEESRLTTTYVVPSRIRLLGAAHGDQHVAGGEQDLEADVEVEQVAGQEGVGDAGGEDQVRRVVDRHRRVVVSVGHALADGVDQHAERHGRGDHQHQRGEPVGDQHDAQRRRPATDRDDQRLARSR